MLSTATALIDAVQESVMGEEVMDFARIMLHTRSEMSQDEFAKAMFIYSGILASNVADMVTKVLLNETQLRELMETIDELETMRNSVLEENNGK